MPKMNDIDVFENKSGEITMSQFIGSDDPISTQMVVIHPDQALIVCKWLQEIAEEIQDRPIGDK